MNKYLLTLDKKFRVEAGYIEGYLVEWMMENPLQEPWLTAFYIKGHIPVTEDQCRELPNKSKGRITINRIYEDVSFTRFWESYGYKVGKKERTQKLWSALSPGERSECLQSISRYQRWLSTKNIEKVYPETYLSQKRWENDFS